ncbi:hypothetical protein P3T24_006318 [Paraburkholderia sp. GAS33]|jgi:hypothetical protein|uniref:hypothetical protein n=1 Tax=unclassified Paraburkholderia TaxID=2615204 RepID=UPI003D19FFA6
MSDAKCITFEAVQLNDRSEYIVRAMWPDGYEQQITGFTDDAEARAWITNDSRGWLDWMARRPHPSN